MSLQEMTKALNEDMEDTSAPGVDWFIVDFIQKIWDSLGVLVVKPVNECKANKSKIHYRGEGNQFFCKLHWNYSI